MRARAVCGARLQQERLLMNVALSGQLAVQFQRFRKERRLIGSPMSWGTSAYRYAIASGKAERNIIDIKGALQPVKKQHAAVTLRRRTA